MYQRTSSVRVAGLFLVTWATCLIALQPTFGQCGSGAAPPTADDKPAWGCGGPALPAPAHTASATRKPIAGDAVGPIDLAGYFDSLGADASLWYQHVQTLANPAFEGRAPGTRGAELAAEYIEFYFRQYGLQPVFSNNADQGPHADAHSGMSYRQRFSLDGTIAAGCRVEGAKAITQGNVESTEVATENVAGALQGRGKLKGEWIVIGGHYDAPGRPSLNSPCYADGKLLPGADDNASGTAAVLVLAKRLAGAYAACGNDADVRSILFIAFAAEETGLNGSRHFVENTPVPLDKIHAMLNLDMVGRMRQDTLWVAGMGTATEFMDLLEPLLRESGLHVITEPGGTGSDQVSFWNVGVPALFVMTGGHDELHSPADQADTMNPEGAGKVVDLVETITMRLAEHPGALTFAAQRSATASGCCGRPPARAGAGASPLTGCAGISGTGEPPNEAQSAPLQQADLPDTPTGRCAAAFFQAFNSGSDDQLIDFESRNRAASSLAARPMEDRIAQANKLRADWGTLTPLRVVGAGAAEITVLARSSRTSECWTMTFQFEDQSPHGLVSITIRGPVPPESQASSSQPIDERLRKDTVKQIADALRETYVYPDIGERLAEVLAKHESEGRYNGINSAGDFAKRLTTDLFAVCKDHHLSVRLATDPVCGATCASSDEVGEDNRNNYGFRKAELLPGNIGYIKLDMFHGSKRAQEVAAAALASVAGCDALIFDLRANGGGSPEMIQFISSYLFDKPTHLNSFYDRLNNKTSETWTLETVPGKRFPCDLPVYVLTSSFTGSAAEEFTYNLKNLGRATIVGETTIGAAHLVTERTINGQFLLQVPYARAYNPITKKNWEKVGVSPDIQVPASEALEAACKDAVNRMCGAPAAPQSPTADDYRILSKTGVATIPFKMLGDDIVLTVELNGKELDLGLDNGSLWDQLFLYGSPRIDALGLEYDEVKVQVASGGTGPMATANMTSGLTIRLPNVELRNQSAIVASAASGLADLFDGEDGAISGSLFRHFVVRIDFDRMVIVLTKPDRFTAPASVEALTMTPIGMGAYTIPCTIQMAGGKPASLNPGIDLGSISPLLLFVGTDKDVALPERVIETSLGAGVQGEVIGQVGRVRSLQLGQYTLTDIITGFTRMELWPGNGDDGLVGMPVLSRFHVTFDYGNERLYLEPNRRFNETFEFDMSGLRLKANGDGSFVIARIVPGSPAGEVGLQVGDIVLQIDGTDTREFKRWQFGPLFCQIGKMVTLKVARDGQEREVSLKLRRLI